MRQHSLTHKETSTSVAKHLLQWCADAGLLLALMLLFVAPYQVSLAQCFRNSARVGEEVIGANGRYDSEDGEGDPNDAASTPEGEQLIVDSDCDGLSDSFEEGVGTDPMDADTDNDGILDGDEVNGFYNPEKEIYTHPVASARWALRPTSPLNPDSDNDGLPDGLELGLTQTGANYSEEGRNDYNDDWYNDIFKDNRSFDLPDGWETTYYPLDYHHDWSSGDPLPTFVSQPSSAVPTITDPLDWDTNHDGVLDSLEDVNRNGILDPGETDPSRGCVNLPPPPAWTYFQDQSSLIWGTWRSISPSGKFYLQKEENTFEEPRLFLYFEFGVNLGVESNNLTLQETNQAAIQFSRYNVDYPIHDQITLGPSDVEGNGIITFRGDFIYEGYSPFVLQLAENQSKSLKEGGGTYEGGAFNPEQTDEFFNCKWRPKSAPRGGGMLKVDFAPL